MDGGLTQFLSGFTSQTLLHSLGRLLFIYVVAAVESNNEEVSMEMRPPRVGTNCCHFRIRVHVTILGRNVRKEFGKVLRPPAIAVQSNHIEWPDPRIEHHILVRAQWVYNTSFIPENRPKRPIPSDSRGIC